MVPPLFTIVLLILLVRTTSSSSASTFTSTRNNPLMENAEIIKSSPTCENDTSSACLPSGAIHNDNNDDDDDDDNPLVSSLTVRFFLIRHGETIANREGLVVGQWDSPLSTLGRQQAMALGRTALVRDTVFWRHYSSDLGRAQQTAHHVIASPPHLGDDGDVSQHDDVSSSPLSSSLPLTWILDERIREIAKGARQEFPKTWDYERAVEERRRRGEGLPLLETSEEAWKRIATFIANVLDDAWNEFGTDESTNATTDGERRRESNNTDHNTHDETPSDETPRRIVNVMVITHAGTLRTLLKKMTPLADPSLHHVDDPHHPPNDSKRLTIPNTSVTILDVTPRRAFLRHQPRRKRAGDSDMQDYDLNGASNNRNDGIANSDSKIYIYPDVEIRYQQLWSTEVVEFLWTGHIIDLATTTNDE